MYKLLLFLNGFALLWLYFTVSKLFCQEVFYLFIISLPVPVCHLLHPDYEYISSYLLPSVPIMPVQRSDSEFSQHHKTAPGPPSAIAVPTPTMLPVPIAFNNSIPSFPPYSFICKKTPGIFHPRSLLPTIFFDIITLCVINFKLILVPALVLKMSTLNSTFFHVFIVLPFCTIRSLFYCIFSLLGNAIVRLPLLPASHAPYFRSYASCFTSSSNSSPAE